MTRGNAVLRRLPLLSMLFLASLTACRGKSDDLREECWSDSDCEPGLACVWFWEKDTPEESPGLCTYTCDSDEDCPVECHSFWAPGGFRLECRDGYCYPEDCE